MLTCLHPPLMMDRVCIFNRPHVTINPSHCLTIRHLRALFPDPEKVTIAAGSTLVIDGPGEVSKQATPTGVINLGQSRCCALGLTRFIRMTRISAPTRL